ncbi:MAG: lipopolysaccharide biosynthesis protein [Pirellula sp.]
MRQEVTTSLLMDSATTSEPSLGSPDVKTAQSFRLKRAFAATVVTQAFNIVAMLLALISVPLYLHWLGDERYGLLLTGLAYGGFLMFADAGLSWSSMLLISQAKGRQNEEEVALIVRASIVLAASSSLIVLLVVSSIYGLLKAGYTFGLFPTHPEFAGLFWAVGLSTVTSLGFSAFYNVFIGFQEAHIAAAYQGTGRLAATFASLAAAASGASVGVVLLSGVACSIALGAFAAIHCVRRNRSAFSKGAWWQPVQFRIQFLTGMKSLIMQMGGVIIGSAPIITLSRSGAALVPTYTIPLTLLNTPLSIVQSLNANMQAAYGEAIGANDHIWIANTVRVILRQTLILLCFLVAGFTTVSRPVVELWTGGKVLISEAMQWSVVGVASCLAVNSIFRFALSGMNRHRLTGISEIAFGVLALGLCSFVVRSFGVGYIGIGVVVAYLLTCGWIIPRELSRELGGVRLFPDATFACRLLLCTVVAITAGKLLESALSSQPKAMFVVLVGTLVAVSFVLVLRWVLVEDFSRIYGEVQRHCLRFSTRLKVRN